MQNVYFVSKKPDGEFGETSDNKIFLVELSPEQAYRKALLLPKLKNYFNNPINQSPDAGAINWVGEGMQEVWDKYNAITGPVTEVNPGALKIPVGTILDELPGEKSLNEIVEAVKLKESNTDLAVRTFLNALMED